MKSWQQRLLTLGTVLSLLLVQPGQSEPGSNPTAPSAKITPTGDGIELAYRGGDGATATAVIPLYKVGSARYFSAGVGVEERAVQYPPFPLKLIFVSGERAYVTQVAVTIKAVTGATSLLVPGEQVTGPWLFVDLPAGTYDITAIRRDRTEITHRVEVVAGRTKVAYFRWKE